MSFREEFDHIRNEWLRFFNPKTHEEEDALDELVKAKVDSFRNKDKDPLDYVLIELLDFETTEVKLVWRKKS